MKNINEKRREIISALRHYEIDYEEVTTNQSQGNFIVAISKENSDKKLKDFANYLKEQKLRFQSSISSNDESITLIIYNDF